MNNRKIQQNDSAGRTKLTAVTIGHGRSKKQFFAMLEHDVNGSAKLPHATLNRALTQLGVRRGDTYTAG